LHNQTLQNNQKRKKIIIISRPKIHHNRNTTTPIPPQLSNQNGIDPNDDGAGVNKQTQQHRRQSQAVPEPCSLKRHKRLQNSPGTVTISREREGKTFPLIVCSLSDLVA